MSTNPWETSNSLAVKPLSSLPEPCSTTAPLPPVTPINYTRNCLSYPNRLRIAIRETRLLWRSQKSKSCKLLVMQTDAKAHCRRKKKMGDGAIWAVGRRDVMEELPQTWALLGGKLQSCAWLGFGQLSCALPLLLPYSSCDQATMDQKG